MKGVGQAIAASLVHQTSVPSVQMQCRMPTPVEFWFFRIFGAGWFSRGAAYAIDAQAARRRRCSKPKPARLYIWRLSTLSRLICPSTGLVLQGRDRAACTAGRSWRRPLAKARSSDLSAWASHALRSSPPRRSRTSAANRRARSAAPAISGDSVSQEKMFRVP